LGIGDIATVKASARQTKAAGGEISAASAESEEEYQTNRIGDMTPEGEGVRETEGAAISAETAAHSKRLRRNIHQLAFRRRHQPAWQLNHVCHSSVLCY
jgi:hypothetical protein